MRHHTKDKGDSGLGHIISDLLDHNIQVALPISEHLPFDLIAISEDNRLRKISVKFRRAVKEAIRVQGRSSWSDKKGVHVVVHEKGLYDALALYCPDTCKCYYVKSSEFSESLSLKLVTPKNNQKTGIKMADKYTDPNRLF